MSQWSEVRGHLPGRDHALQEACNERDIALGERDAALAREKALREALREIVGWHDIAEITGGGSIPSGLAESARAALAQPQEG